MLERLGVNTRDSRQMETKNVAAVMVTAELPAFARSGSRIDVAVSALGDAKNLLGGTLLVTPLLGADGEVYAVAQGTLATGGLAARGAAHLGHARRAHRRTHRQRRDGGARGAIPARQHAPAAPALRNPDLTTARRIAAAINQILPASPRPTDPSHRGARSGGPRPDRDSWRRSRSCGSSPTARQGGHRRSQRHHRDGRRRAHLHRGDRPGQPDHPRHRDPAGQPAGAILQRRTTVVPRTQVQVDDQQDQKLRLLQGGVSLRDLVDGLNALGVGPRDMITILQAIKAAGALQADLVVR